ncbi:hypothetical protein DL98DRAFT_512695 [Cadophora sp. DSE1049]|nr:hypothetical protein DL98DRAFT_512695 [Cadophora sp. DSE1049]
MQLEHMEDSSSRTSPERDTIRSNSTVREIADECFRPKFSTDQRTNSDATTWSRERKSLDDSEFECSKSETSISSNSAPMTPNLFPQPGMFYKRSFELPEASRGGSGNVSMQDYRHESVSMEAGSSSNLQPCYLDGLWPNLADAESAFAAMLGQGTSTTSMGNWCSNLSDSPSMADGSAFSCAGFGGTDPFVWS